jgi:alkyl hydroperoxide reductase subunit AhpC
VASVDERFGGRGVRVIGVHAPEFDQERDPANVRREVKRLGVAYPIVLDNEMTMWDALDNRAWPALYVIDRYGMIQKVHVGEIHAGTADARRLEELIETLLKTPPG